MKRNDLTTVSQLLIGDRFHKLNDKKKEVWEMVPSGKKVTFFQTYSHWAKKDTDKFPTPMKGNSQVVYLRSATEKAATSSDV